MYAYARKLRFIPASEPKKLDEAFEVFCDLTNKYPNDCAPGYDYFFYNTAVDYYETKGDVNNAIACLDTVIRVVPKYKFNLKYPVERYAALLTEAGRNEEAITAL